MRKGLWIGLLCLIPALGVWGQPTDIILKHLRGYFLTNRTELGKGMNYVVITKEKQFDKMFGIAKTMTNKIDYPDFKKEMVLMLELPETNRETCV